MVFVLLLVLGVAPGAIGREEVKVPFSAIKPSCYGEIDISKVEFALSEVGRKCVTESWLEENLTEDVTKQPKDKKTSKETKNRIVVPKTAVVFRKIKVHKIDTKNAEVKTNSDGDKFHLKI